MALTERQRGELNAAIAAYIKSLGSDFTAVADGFAAKASVSAEAIAAAMDRRILERKWTSVVRLQRKAMQLEKEIDQLKSRLERGEGGGGRLQERMADARDDFRPEGEPTRVLTGHRDAVNAIALHPRVPTAASASDDTDLRLWDIEGGSLERTLRGHTGPVHGAAFSPDGGILASCGADMTVKMWDSGSGKCTRTLVGHEHTVSAVAFLPSGEYVVSASRDATVRVWEVATGFCARTFSGHREWVKAVAVSGDGARCATGGVDQAILLWNPSTGRRLGELRGHEHVVEALAFSGISQEEGIRKRKAQEDVIKAARARLTGQAPGAGDAAAGAAEAAERRPPTATGALLVSASRDKTLRLWSVETVDCLAVLSGHDNWVRSVFMHPRAPLFFSSSDDKSIRVWDVTSMRCVHTLEKAHDHFVGAVAAHPAVPIVVSASVDQSLHVWHCVS